MVDYLKIYMVANDLLKLNKIINTSLINLNIVLDHTFWLNI